MAWTVSQTLVTTAGTGVLVYTAAAAVTVRIRATSPVSLSPSPVSVGIPIAPGDVLTLDLSIADEVYARCRVVAGVPPSATVWVAAGP